MTRILSALALVVGLSSLCLIGSAKASAQPQQNNNEIMKLIMGAMMSADPQFGQPCGRSSECGANESCVNGICQTGYGGSGCVGDYQCPVGERCSNGICKVSFTSSAASNGLRCVSSRDCPPGDSCVRGNCQFNGGVGSCSGDTDCPVGEHCRDMGCY